MRRKNIAIEEIVAKFQMHLEISGVWARQRQQIDLGMGEGPFRRPNGMHIDVVFLTQKESIP